MTVPADDPQRRELEARVIETSVTLHFAVLRSAENPSALQREHAQAIRALLAAYPEWSIHVPRHILPRDEGGS